MKGIRPTYKPPELAVTEDAPVHEPQVRPPPSPYRLDWAAALKRVYAAAMAGRFATSPSPPCGGGTDVLKCARCGGSRLAEIGARRHLRNETPLRVETRLYPRLAAMPFT